MGSLRIFGDEVGTLPPNKRPVNTVFQNYALFPHMNVLDNVAFGLKHAEASAKAEARRQAPARRSSLVQFGGLREPASRTRCRAVSNSESRSPAPSSTSRRCCLLDEPLGALDLKLRQEMQGELKSLQSELGRELRLRHPRPGRGVDDERPHRGHARRPSCSRSVAPKRSTNGRPTGSSPTSSARPTCSKARSRIPDTVCLANGARVNARIRIMPAGTKPSPSACAS